MRLSWLRSLLRPNSRSGRRGGPNRPLLRVEALEERVVPQATPTQVRDINPRTNSALPSDLRDVNGTLYFAANDGQTGHELWRSDGTPDGTFQVANLADDSGGLLSSNPNSLLSLGGTVYFFANDMSAGPQLWRSNTSDSSTFSISAPLLIPSELTNVNSTLYFVDGGTTLYRSTGNPGGTQQVATFASIGGLTAVGSRLYFTASTAAAGLELYEYDGVTARLIDIVPGAADSAVGNLTNVEGTLFFTALEPGFGLELYQLNGSNPVRFDILAGNDGSSPSNLTDVNGTLYFRATTLEGGTELYRFNGAPELIDIVPGMESSIPSNLANVGGTLYFNATTTNAGTELYRYDGLTATLLDIVPGPGSSNPGRPVLAGGTLYVTATTPATGGELFRITGNAVTLVADIVPGPSGSFLGDLTSSGGRLFFTTVDALSGVELWTSNGTAAGTVQVKEINAVGPGSNPANLTRVGNALYFTANDGLNGLELWRSDGTTTTLIDIVSGPAGSNPSNLINVNGTLYLRANTPAGDAELYRIDGTTPTPIDVETGPGSSNPSDLTDVNGTLYFVATTAASGRELFRLDGASPTLIDVELGPTGSSPSQLTNVAGTLYFVATTAAAGTEVYQLNGSTPLPREVVSGPIGSSPTALTAVGSTLYFAATTSAAGSELYQLSGTTPVLFELVTGPAGSNPVELTDVNGTLYFVAIRTGSGVEVWKSNGTPAGTVPVTTTLTSPAELTASGGLLYFVDGFQDLYRTDGTVTVRLLSGFPFIEKLTDSNGTLVFAADNGVNGEELWQSDGSIGGTQLLADVYPGLDPSGLPYTSNPAGMTEVNGTLFFSAEDQRGRELWKVTLLTPPETLRVTSFTPTPSGFVAVFNRAIDPQVLNLYTTQTAALGPADVTLTGDTSGPVRGSLVVDLSNTRITFVRTGGLLPNDSYTVTLRSAANGFREPSGNLLDGDGNGSPGGDYTNTFTSTAGSVVVSVPDLARGPGQAVAVPLLLSASAGVTSVALRLRYDPALLSITAANVAEGIAGAQVTLDTTTAPGVAIFTFTSPALPAGVSEFARLTATVPDMAASRYLAKQVLDLFNVTVNGAAAGDDDGVHINAYFSDATGNGTLTSADAARIQRVALGLDSGFEAYRLADARIVADVNANGRVDSTDATWTLQKAVGLPRPQIPDRPVGIAIPTPPGLDPLLFLPKLHVGRPGDTVTVPVLLDQSAELESVDLALSYDVRRLELVGVQRGSLTSDFELLLVNADPTSGTVRVGLSRSAGPIGDRGPGSVVQLTFRIRPDASPGQAIVNLRESLNGTTTALNEGGLDLNPDPSDRVGDVLDGAITVLRPRRLGDVVRDLVFAAVSEPSRASDVVRAFLSGRRGDIAPR